MQNLPTLIKDRVDKKQIKLDPIMGIYIIVYANDVFVFCKAKIDSFTTIKEVFSIFEGNTGLRVSEEKSEVFFFRFNKR